MKGSLGGPEVAKNLQFANSSVGRLNRVVAAAVAAVAAVAALTDLTALAALAVAVVAAVAAEPCCCVFKIVFPNRVIFSV